MTELIRSITSGQRPRPRALVVPLLLLVAILGATFAVAAAARNRAPEARTITLVARDMAFFLPGDDTVNPRLVVERGELVRLVLLNEDAGMLHDVQLPSLKASTALLEKAGTSAEILLRVPDEPGQHDYFCGLHSKIMRGSLEVR
jgi:plastocyanin